MLKSVLSAAAAAFVLLMPMAALSARGVDPHAVPVFSGKYVFTGSQVCPSGTAQLTGDMNFNPDTGKVKFNQITIVGSPKHEVTGSGTETFSNSMSTLTFGTATYHAYFGQVKKGKVQTALMIAVVDGGPDDCGVQLNIYR